MIRRFFTSVLMVVLIGFCGYNWLETRALHAEVSDLRTRQFVTDKKLSEKTHADPTDWKTSAVALEREIEVLQKQAQSPETRRRLALLQSQARLLGRQAEALWQQVQKKE